MDALPVTERTPIPFKSTVIGEYQGNQVGVMHACDKDTHVAILMGVAQILTELKDKVNGTVNLYFNRQKRVRLLARRRCRTYG